jgi:hypothetical protein
MPIVAWRAKNVFLFFRAPTANIELFSALVGGSLLHGGFDRLNHRDALYTLLTPFRNGTNRKF